MSEWELEQEIKRLQQENLKLRMENEELKSRLIAMNSIYGLTRESLDEEIDDRPRDPSLLEWSQDLPTIDSGYQE